MSWSRVSVFLLLLVASSCLEAVEHVENDIQHDSPEDGDDPAASEATSGDTELQRQCCEQGKQSADAPGACVGKARRYVKTLSLDDDNAKLCRLAFSGCCKTEKTSVPEKDVKQLGSGPTEKEGATKKKAPKAKRGNTELRTSCCDRGRQSIRQRGSCDVKALSYVRTLTLKRGKAKLCRMLFTGCCNRASRIPTKPRGNVEVRQLGGTTSSKGDADDKAAEPAWKRRLDNRCCNAGKRSAAATPGSCQSRARTTVRKAIARSRVGKSHGRGTTRTDMAACGQTFIRCCNEVPIS
ncbi:hypothetical protein Bbelb_329100 [Branchiostoma belcheri]|nr:hypothetical protein Bbelb_329100 [Branchiostoma belcheri]